MACRLVGAEPLSEPMLECRQLELLGTNFSEILIEILTFSFKKMHLKMPSAKSWPFCLGLNVFKQLQMRCYSSVYGQSDIYRQLRRHYDELTVNMCNITVT